MAMPCDNPPLKLLQTTEQISDLLLMPVIQFDHDFDPDCRLPQWKTGSSVNGQRYALGLLPCHVRDFDSRGINSYGIGDRSRRNFPCHFQEVIDIAPLVAFIFKLVAPILTVAGCH